MPFGNFGKIAVGWGIATFVGIYAFVLSKQSIDKKRYDNMKVRDRMKKANQGDYEIPEESSNRFHRPQAN